MEDAVAVGKKTVENVVKAGTDTAAKSYEKAVAISRTRVDEAAKGTEQVLKSYEDNVAFLKGNVDAVLVSGTKVVNGLRDISKVMLAHVHEQLEANLVYGKAVLGCRSVHELMDLNQMTLKSSLEGLTETSGKITEMSAKTFEEATVPLTERVTAAMDRMAQVQPGPR